MKKTFLLSSAIMFITSVCFAALDVYTSVEVETLGVPTMVTGGLTNATVDVASAKGICNVILSVGAGTTNGAAYTSTATLEQCATDGGTFFTVTNGTGNAVSATCTNSAGAGIVSSIKLEADRLKRYIRLKVTNENDTGVVGGVILYSK